MAHKPNTPRAIDATLLSFLSQTDVLEALESRGAQFTRVTFLKTNGKIASRTGRPKTYSRRVDHETASAESIKRSNAAAQSLAANGNVFLDYPNPEQRKDKRKGFAFNLGRVIALGDVGEHIDEPENA